MNVISVDDEALVLEGIVKILQDMPEISEVHGFSNGEDALEYIEYNDVDVAFLDIHLGTMDGITLAKKAKVIKPTINVIFVTAFADYSMDAMKMHASGYILKPVSEVDVRNELNDLRNPKAITTGPRLKVHCFGNFELQVDGKPCDFKYGKTKELFAYLIDRRGAFCTNGELMASLWEDKEVTPSLENYLRNLISDLRRVLKSHKVTSVITKKKGQICVNITEVDCDYYRWIMGDQKAINQFCGEYMSQYSWAEPTLASIENKEMIRMYGDF